jgi:hypothetical protein
VKTSTPNFLSPKKVFIAPPGWRKKKGMSTREVFAVAAFFLSHALGLALPNTSAGRVEIHQEQDKLRIDVNGRHFTDYIFQGYSRPILFPILGPGGAKMTRNYPLAEGENEDHDHIHHKSFWWGHGDMNGVDFWAESKDAKNAGKVVQEEFVKVASGTTGIIGTKNKYLDKDGKVICTDERTLKIYSGEPGQTFDFEITLHASNGDLTFGDTKEGTMAMRLAETMRLKGKVGHGHIVNSEGVRDDATWGKHAKWVDYYGPVDGKTVGVAIFDHPSNLRHPTTWHVRDYGLFAANPFGLHDFEKKPPETGNHTVKAGQKITFKYRFYIHSGDEKEAKVKEAYEKYVSELPSVLNDQIKQIKLDTVK